ncbi:MAG TPA: hypothetical protein VK915_10395 [Gaiellaceae bacterium]|nr:hypothetical protein [Gaiellaceae bacterium]
MASRGTWIVLAVVAAIAVAAAADALRGDGSAAGPAPEEPSSATTTQAEDGKPVETALAGVLYFTDEGCRLRAVRLPSLEPADAPGWSECRFVLSPDGTRAGGDGSGWDPRSDPRIGRLFQTRDGTISVATNFGPEGEPFAGRAPAWRPDGTLTVVEGGALRARPRGDVLVGSGDLAAAIRGHPGVPGASGIRSIRFEEVAWLDRARVAVLLQANGGTTTSEAVVAVLEDGRPVAVELLGRGRPADLRASPGGRMFAFRTPTGVRVLDARGGTVPTPAVRNARAVAFSPDGRWLAIAARTGVHLLPLGGGERAPRRLPLSARDLAWRGPAGPGDLADAETRARLEAMGVSGRLVVAEPGCRLRALRLPALEWSELGTNAQGLCRFTLAPEGEPVSETATVHGERSTRCSRGRLDVFDAGRPLARLPGACRAAWTPDGRLTFVRDGELWEGFPEPRRIVSRATLRRLLGTAASLEEVAWLDDARLWAAARTREGVVLAAMTTSTLVFSPAFAAQRIDGLQVNRAGMVAARSDRGVVVFDAGGRRALTFPDGREVAWAPSSLVAAIATDGELLFVAPISRDVVSVPVAASDLEWDQP